MTKDEFFNFKKDHNLMVKYHNQIAPVVFMNEEEMLLGLLLTDELELTENDLTWVRYENCELI